MSSSRAVLCLGLLIATMVPQGASAAPRPPTTRWIVNFDDEQCLATRHYGTEQKPLALTLKSPVMGNVIQVGIINSEYGSANGSQKDVTLALGDQQPVRTSLLAFNPQKGKRLHLINVPRDYFAAGRTATSLSVRAPGEINEQFQLTQLEALLRTLDTCTADLKKVWNVREIRGAVTPEPSQPHPALKGLLRSEDYPEIALQEGQSGSVELVMLVDEAGRVADCTVIATSGVASLDAQSCSIVKSRAKFEPAVGPGTKPAKAAYNQRITWRTR